MRSTPRSNRGGYHDGDGTASTLPVLLQQQLSQPAAADQDSGDVAAVGSVLISSSAEAGSLLAELPAAACGQRHCQTMMAARRVTLPGSSWLCAGRGNMVIYDMYSSISLSLCCMPAAVVPVFEGCHMPVVLQRNGCSKP
jgi:hypothetical protein